MNIPKNGEISSRERVHAAIQGKPVDRVPVWYYLNSHTACKMISEFFPTKNFSESLKAKLLWRFFQKKPFFLSDDNRRGLPLLLSFFAVGEYPLELGADIAIISSFSKDYFYRKPHKQDGRMYCNDIFGGVRTLGDGIYLDVCDYPVKDIETAKNFVFPDPVKDHDYAPIEKFRKEHPDACIMAEAFGAQDAVANWLWGMTDFLMAMVEHPEVVMNFQKRWTDYWVEVIVRSIRAGADMIFIYDDYGYNNRTFISDDMWLEFTYPHLKRLIEVTHENGAIAVLHSCGYQMPLLKYYVEAGLDVLQGMQPVAGNDFGEAYTAYGDRLAFITGIDVQKGESQTPDELREDMLANYRTGGRNGRHIFGMTHMLQYTMPDENIRAIFDTTREIQAGIHDG